MYTIINAVSMSGEIVTCRASVNCAGGDDDTNTNHTFQFPFSFPFPFPFPLVSS